MGCGLSKAENGGEVVPAKLRPLLRRRFEEIKTGKSNALKHKEATLSKKQLLKDGVEDDDSRKSVSSPEDSVVAPPLPEHEMTRNEAKEGNGVDAATSPRSSKVGPEPGCNEPIKDQKDCHDKYNDDDNEITDKELVAVEEEALVVKTKEWEGEEGRWLSNVEEYGYLCPGSPSFRVYCIDQSWEDTNDESECTS